MTAVLVKGLAPARGWLVVDPRTGRVVAHQERRNSAKAYARKHGYRVEVRR